MRLLCRQILQNCRNEAGGFCIIWRCADFLKRRRSIVFILRQHHLAHGIAQKLLHLFIAVRGKIAQNACGVGAVVLRNELLHCFARLIGRQIFFQRFFQGFFARCCKNRLIQRGFILIAQRFRIGKKCFFFLCVAQFFRRIDREGQPAEHIEIFVFRCTLRLVDGGGCGVVDQLFPQRRRIVKRPGQRGGGSALTWAHNADNAAFYPVFDQHFEQVVALFDIVENAVAVRVRIAVNARQNLKADFGDRIIGKGALRNFNGLSGVGVCHDIIHFRFADQSHGIQRKVGHGVVFAQHQNHLILTLRPAPVYAVVGGGDRIADGGIALFSAEQLSEHGIGGKLLPHHLCACVLCSAFFGSGRALKFCGKIAQAVFSVGIHNIGVISKIVAVLYVADMLIKVRCGCGRITLAAEKFRKGFHVVFGLICVQK